MRPDLSAPHDAAGNPIPMLTFGEAAEVGTQLHDHWEKLAGSAPLGREDLAWGDVVQFVLRTASAKLRVRSAGSPSDGQG